MQPDNQLLVEYTPVLADERVQRRAKSLVGALWGFVFLLVIVIAIMFYQRSQQPWRNEDYQLWFGVLAFLAIMRIVVALVRWGVAKKYRAEMPQGVAMVISRSGIATPDGSWPWSSISSFGTRRRVIRGPEYVLETAYSDSNPHVFAVDDLAVFPATIDSAVQIYSDGAMAVDLGGIDR